MDKVGFISPHSDSAALILLGSELLLNSAALAGDRGGCVTVEGAASSGYGSNP